MKPSHRFHIPSALVLAFGLTNFPMTGATAAEYVADFESDLGGWTRVKDTSAFHWARRTGGTPTRQTGPAGAHEGEYYVFLKAARNFPDKTAGLVSPDLSGETVGSLSFYYHMYGRHMGTLAVEVFDGSAWNTVWDVTGQQHASHEEPWTRGQIDLSGQSTVEQIRFTAATGSGGKGDIAIDDVTINPNDSTPWSQSENGIYYADGNVGIGTEEPAADLSILGNLSRPLTGSVTMPANSTNVTGVGTLFTEELRVGDSLLVGEEVFVVTVISGNTELTVDAPHTSGELDVTAYADSDLLSVRAGAEVEALVVDKSGNVGVGTAEPRARLEAKGTFIRQVFVATGLGSYDETDPAAGGSRIVSRTLTFPKLHADTAIRILYSDTLRVTGSSASAARWEIRIDGAHPPGGAIYQDKHSNAGHDNVEPTTILGYATGVPAGSHEIQVWVNKVGNYASNTLTGWYDSRWTIEAQEVWVQ